jgi:hypothetical protein
MPLAPPIMLCRVLVAHTIELDNEAEYRRTHRTSREAAHLGPETTMAERRTVPHRVGDPDRS